VRPQITQFKNWKVDTVEPGDHGWKITLLGPNGQTGAIHTGHTPIAELVAKKLIGKRVRTVVMDTVNTQVYFDDFPITFNALDYLMEFPSYEEPYSPQWPEEREEIGEHPPQLGEE